jgi:prepilin-type N-terminal cleavage/methylation domain-containing protein
MSDRAGFTLIELLVVLAVVALMLTIAVPRYVDRVEMARETALKTDLKVMREAIDHFDGDRGRLPKSLDELVTRTYLKAVPLDPITGRNDTWVSVSAADDALLHPAPPAESSAAPSTGSASISDGLADVRSGAVGKGRDGTEYKEW